MGLLNGHLVIMFGSVIDPDLVQEESKEMYLYRVCMERVCGLRVYFFRRHCKLLSI